VPGLCLKGKLVEREVKIPSCTSSAVATKVSDGPLQQRQKV